MLVVRSLRAFSDGRVEQARSDLRERGLTAAEVAERLQRTDSIRGQSAEPGEGSCGFDDPAQLERAFGRLVEHGRLDDDTLLLAAYRCFVEDEPDQARGFLAAVSGGEHAPAAVTLEAWLALADDELEQAGSRFAELGRIDPADPHGRIGQALVTLGRWDDRTGAGIGAGSGRTRGTGIGLGASSGLGHGVGHGFPLGGIIEAQQQLSRAALELGSHDLRGATQVSWEDHRVSLGYHAAQHGSGWALGLLGRHQEALEPLEGLLALDPTDPGPWLAKGGALVSLGRLAEAERAFGHVLELEPEHPGAHRGLAGIHRLRGELDAAEEQLRQAASSPVHGFTCPHEGLGLLTMLPEER